LTEPTAPTYTLLSCHYGDLFWIKHLLSQVGKFSTENIVDVVIVDQSRSMEKELSALPLVSAVMSFEPDTQQIAIEGHDHPAALDRALATYEFTSSHVIVMDSDAFPIKADWLERLDDISLALVPGSDKNTHPCLMVFPVRLAHKVSFSEGYLDRAHGRGPDTGRRVGTQLQATGEPVTLLTPTPAFNGSRGSFYLDGSYYHHGHGSFFGGDHEQYRGFVSQASEKLYRDKLVSNRFTLSPLDVAALFIRYLWRRFTNRIRLALAGPSTTPR